MQDERMRILKMVEEGKISAEDATKLIAALDTEGSQREPKGGASQAHNGPRPHGGQGQPNYQGQRRQEGSFAEDLGKKFDVFIKDMEPKFKKFTKTVAEKTAEAASKVSESFQQAERPQHPRQGQGQPQQPRQPEVQREVPPVKPEARTAPVQTDGNQVTWFETQVTESGNELNLSGLRGNISVKGYNGDKISAKIIYSAKVGGVEPEMMALGNKYFLHFDENQFNAVGIEAFVPEYMFDQIYLKQNIGNITLSNIETKQVDIVCGTGRIVTDNVKTESYHGKVDSGDIKLSQLVTKSGKIVSHNGVIEGHMIDGESIQMDTTNGNISVSATDFSAYTDYIWALSASNGQLMLNLPSGKDIGYHLKARTALGNIQMGMTDLEYKEQTDTIAEGKSPWFEEASKKVEMTLETSNGSLIVN